MKYFGIQKRINTNSKYVDLSKSDYTKCTILVMYTHRSSMLLNSIAHLAKGKVSNNYNPTEKTQFFEVYAKLLPKDITFIKSLSGVKKVQKD